jgi:acetylornithine deacetylase
MVEGGSLCARVDERQALGFLKAMIRHRSYSETEGEKVLAGWMVERMRELGLDAYLQPVPGGRFNAIGVWRGTGGGRSLMFNGHLDTNPATEGWTVDPWGGVVDDAFIYGIGVSNMKAGDAAYFSAVGTLVGAGVRLKGDVILTFVVGELQGGVGTLAAIDHGLTADCFINAEPTDLQALTMHAGSVKFVIELTGMTRHLSKREEAVDALAAACELVPTLNLMAFSGAASPAHAGINRVHVGVLHGALGRELHEWRVPQVADFVRLRAAGRYAPGQTVEGALGDLREVLARLEARYPGLKTSVAAETDVLFPPFEVSAGSRIVRTVNAAYQQVRGRSQPTGAIHPPALYGTDAAHLSARLGIEGVVCGPGGRYNTMPDERVDIPDYLDMIRIYLLSMLDICEVA